MLKPADSGPCLTPRQPEMCMESAHIVFTRCRSACAHGWEVWEEAERRLASVFSIFLPEGIKSNLPTQKEGFIFAAESGFKVAAAS